MEKTSVNPMVIGFVMLNNPPYNILQFDYLRQLRERFTELRLDPEVQVIVFKSAHKKVFSTGADVKEIMKLGLSKNSARGAQVLKELHAFFSSIANCPKPTIAAIRGACLGGGLELALACHFRVADKKTYFGLPEVSLGVIPGLGGTQRLPRLIGAENALRIILDAKDRFIYADLAKQEGLIDTLIENDFDDGVVAFVNEVLNKKVQRLSWQRDVGESAEFKSFIRRDKSLMAIVAAQKAVIEGVQLPLTRGLALEQKLFLDCLFSKETRKNFKAVRRAYAWKKIKKWIVRIFKKKPR